jgi:Fe2+ transport system protein FeoA
MTTGTLFTCLLCGARFTHGGQVCTSCPFAAGCDVVACPRCGYQFPRSSRLVEWVRALGRRLRSKTMSHESLVRPLDRLPVGARAEIVYLSPREPDQLVRLANLGLVPGATVHLQQTSPAAVIRVGETTLALDPEIAGEIYVKPRHDGSRRR